jgi:hypothetical protein
VGVAFAGKPYRMVVLVLFAWEPLQCDCKMGIQFHSQLTQKGSPVFADNFGKKFSPQTSTEKLSGKLRNNK